MQSSVSRNGMEEWFLILSVGTAAHFLLESRSIGVLARYQVESTMLSNSQGWPPALARMLYDRPLPGKFCFSSVKRKQCLLQDKKTWNLLFQPPRLHRDKSNIFYKSLASFRFIHTHYLSWTSHPPREAYFHLQGNQGLQRIHDLPKVMQLIHYGGGVQTQL